MHQGYKGLKQASYGIATPKQAVLPVLSITLSLAPCRYGRLRMQSFGFLALALLFGICGVAFPALTANSSGLMAFQALYFLSSFWNQVRPPMSEVDTCTVLQTGLC